MNKVFIITCARKQDHNGEFDRTIHTVWLTKKDARTELRRIEDINNSERNKEHGYRARQPNMQPDDLSVQRLEGSFYECQSFYSINEHLVNTRP